MAVRSYSGMEPLLPSAPGTKIPPCADFSSVTCMQKAVAGAVRGYLVVVPAPGPFHGDAVRGPLALTRPRDVRLDQRGVAVRRVAARLWFGGEGLGRALGGLPYLARAPGTLVDCGLGRTAAEDEHPGDPERGDPPERERPVRRLPRRLRPGPPVQPVRADQSDDEKRRGRDEREDDDTHARTPNPAGQGPRSYAPARGQPCAHRNGRPRTMGAAVPFRVLPLEAVTGIEPV